jgi:hypothetical protein
MLLILLLLVPMIGIFIIVTLPYRTRSIFNYNLLMGFMTHIAIFLIAYPSRAIVSILTPYIDNIYVVVSLMTLIAYLCISIKSLSSSNKFPTKHVVV